MDTPHFQLFSIPHLRIIFFSAFPFDPCITLNAWHYFRLFWTCVPIKTGEVLVAWNAFPLTFSFSFHIFTFLPLRGLKDAWWRLKVNKFSHFQKNLRKKREKKYTLKRHIRKMKMSFPNHLSKDLDRRTFCSSDAGRHHFKMNTFFIFLSCVLTNTLSFHIIVHLSKEKKKDENGKTSCFMSFHKKKDELRVPL